MKSKRAFPRSYDVPDDVDEAELDTGLEALGEGWNSNSMAIGEDETIGENKLPSFLQEEVPQFMEEGEGKEQEQMVAAGYVMRISR